MERTNRMSKLDDLSNAMADAGVYDDYDENTGIGDNAESPDTDAAAVPIAEGATVHFSTPWMYDGEDDVYAEGGEDSELVAMLAGPSKLCDANGRHIVACVNEHACLTAERDWYRAGLFGISQGYYDAPDGYAAKHATAVLAYVKPDAPNPVDALVTANRALVKLGQTILDRARRVDKEGIAYCRHCGYLWGYHEECIVPALESTLALAKGGAK